MAPTAGHFAWARSTCMMGSCRSCGRLQGRPGEPQGRAAGGPNAPGSPHLASTTWAAPSSRDVALGKRRPLPAAAPGEAGGQEAGGVALAGFRQSTRVCNDLAAAEGAICVFSGVTWCSRFAPGWKQENSRIEHNARHLRKAAIHPGSGLPCNELKAPPQTSPLVSYACSLPQRPTHHAAHLRASHQQHPRSPAQLRSAGAAAPPPAAAAERRRRPCWPRARCD